MTTLPIPFSHDELALTKDSLRRAIIQEMNPATTISGTTKRGKLADSAIRIAREKSEASQRALLALLDHLNSFHFQRSR